MLKRILARFMGLVPQFKLRLTQKEQVALVKAGLFLCLALFFLLIFGW